MFLMSRNSLACICLFVFPFSRQFEPSFVDFNSCFDVSSERKLVCHYGILYSAESIFFLSVVK